MGSAGLNRRQFLQGSAAVAVGGLLRGYLKSGMRAAPPADQEVRNGERAGGARAVADDLAGVR